MLHVNPAAVIAAPPSPPAFDPIAYIAYMRECGVVMRARLEGERRTLSWDIIDARAGDERGSDPRFDVHAAPENKRAVWEVLRAEMWISAARECGLVVVPWIFRPGERGGVLEFGQEMDGPNDYEAATRRLMRHPDRDATEGLRKGVVFETLCGELGIRPDDPAFCAKVNERMAISRRAAEG